jgi:hypothetical protein
MDNKKPLEGEFNGSLSTECFSCGKRTEGREYRRNWSEELYLKTGGKEGRTIYCVPCGEKIVDAESKEANERIKKNQEQSIKDVRETIKNCFAIIEPLVQRIAQEDMAGTVEDYKKIKSVQKRINELGKGAIIDPFTNTEDPLIKRDIENLKKSCLDLINEYIPPKDRKIGDSKRGHVIHPACCTPRNVKLEENDSEQYYYCDYC